MVWRHLLPLSLRWAWCSSLTSLWSISTAHSHHALSWSCCDACVCAVDEWVNTLIHSLTTVIQRMTIMLWSRSSLLPAPSHTHTLILSYSCVELNDGDRDGVMHTHPHAWSWVDVVVRTHTHRCACVELHVMMMTYTHTYPWLGIPSCVETCSGDSDVVMRRDAHTHSHLSCIYIHSLSLWMCISILSCSYTALSV